MNICESNKAISQEVRDFMLNVSDVKEESITDYLVWKWSVLDKRIRFVNISTFSRHEENITTGADFELELWVVGNQFNLPLLFQAKKFIKNLDAYVAKLNYPNESKNQLSTLLNYAKEKKYLPFYMYYSLADEKTKVLCRKNDVSNVSLFISDALTVKNFADRKYGRRISKNDLLSKSNPFHCLFCCPLLRGDDYFNYLFHYFPALRDNIEYEIPKEIPLPDYASYLLNDDFDKKEMVLLIKENKLERIRNIVVFDLRDS